ncbi:MAG: hypothetical protein U0528_01990 [Anaerolineae bacterium]
MTITTQTSIRVRIRQIAIVKAVLAAVVLLIMLITFPRPLPLLVAVLDLLLVPVYVLIARRYPITATYLLLAETALALTPRQFVQGYVNGINWVLYLPLPLAASYVIGSHRAPIRATILVTVIALPITLIAALTLEPRLERSEVFTLIAYLMVVLWALAWLGVGQRRVDGS